MDCVRAVKQYSTLSLIYEFYSTPINVFHFYCVSLEFLLPQASVAVFVISLPSSVTYYVLTTNFCCVCSFSCNSTGPMKIILFTDQVIYFYSLSFHLKILIWGSFFLLHLITTIAHSFFILVFVGGVVGFFFLPHHKTVDFFLNFLLWSSC